eukprot:7898893-Ditylum_brightwellii.AAC.1
MDIVKACMSPGSPSALEEGGDGKKWDAVENSKKTSAVRGQKEDGALLPCVDNFELQVTSKRSPLA